MSESVIEASRNFFHEVLLPILRRDFPQETAQTAFGVFGYGSEVMRMDDEYSSDHHWGIRINAVMPDALYAAGGAAIGQAVAGSLPEEYHGYVVRAGFSGGTGLSITGLESYLKTTIGIDHAPCTYGEWLGAPEEDIIHVINGEIWLDEPGIPAQWNASPLTVDWGRERVYHHTLTPQGATFAATQEEFAKAPRATDMDVDAQSRLYLSSWRGGQYNYAGPNIGFIARLTVKDFTPVAFIGRAPLLVATSNRLPAASARELFALARSKPGQITYASAGLGSINQISTELIALLAGVKLTHIPYKGGAPALNDLAGGHVDIYVSSIPQALQLVRSGQIKTLAVTSRKRLAILPDVPTLEESGTPGAELGTWWGIVGPAGMQADVVAVLNAEINNALNAPEIGAFLAHEGAEAEAMTPRQFGDMMRRETERWTKVAHDTNMSID